MWRGTWKGERATALLTQSGFGCVLYLCGYHLLLYTGNAANHVQMRLSHVRSNSSSGILTLHPPYLAPQFKSKLYLSLAEKGCEFQLSPPAPVSHSP